MRGFIYIPKNQKVTVTVLMDFPDMFLKSVRTELL